MSPDPLATPPPAPPIDLHFVLDENDMLAFYTAASEIDPRVKEAWAKYRRQYHLSIGLAAFLSLALLAGLVTNMFGMRDPEGRPVIAIALAAAVVGSVWTALQYRKALTRNALASHVSEWAKSEAVRYHLGPQSVTIGPDGLILRTIHHDITERWSGITEVRDTPDGIYFQRRDNLCYLVPTRIFASPTEARAVLDRSRAWLDASGHGDARRIRAFLAERDVQCLGCNYNLRGVTARVCPECGRELDSGLIAAATPTGRAD